MTDPLDINFLKSSHNCLSFEFFLQNKTQEAIIYKFPKNNTNIQVYGIYSTGMSSGKKILGDSEKRFFEVSGAV